MNTRPIVEKVPNYFARTNILSASNNNGFGINLGMSLIY